MPGRYRFFFRHTGTWVIFFFFEHGYSFSHPDCHCRLRTSTGSTAKAGRGLKSIGFITAGWEFHPTPKWLQPNRCNLTVLFIQLYILILYFNKGKRQLFGLLDCSSHSKHCIVLSSFTTPFKKPSIHKISFPQDWQFPTISFIVPPLRR